MSADISLQGSLETTTFVALVRRVHEQKLSGTLTITQGQAKKVLRFDQGEICAAASNLTQDSVLGLLVTNGNLTQADADEMREQIAAGKPMGEALSQSGKVSREVLVGLRLEQIVFILGSLYEWNKGEYKLENDAAASDKKPAPLNVTTPELILRAARQPRDAARLTRLLGDTSAPRQMMGDAFARCAMWQLQPQEGYLLTRLDAPMTIADLTMMSGLPESETLLALYVLECAGLVTAQQPASAPVHQAPRQASATANSTASTSAQKASASSSDSQSASAQNSSQADSMRIPLNLKKTAEPELSSEEQLADIKRMAALIAGSCEHHEVLGLTQNATRSQVKNAFTKLTKKYHPDRYHNQADEATIASLSDIFARVRKAYEVLKEIAPDGPDPTREPVQKAEPVIEQAQPVIERGESSVSKTEYVKVAQMPLIERNDYTPATASDVAVNAIPLENVVVTAATSDESLSSAKSSAESETLKPDSPQELISEAPASTSAEEDEEQLPAPEMYFRHALARYQSGDLLTAIELLQRAVKMQPNNALYQDQLATLLAYNPRRRKEAEVHLLRAIELDPQNAAYHFHLALLYKTVGFTTRAEDKLREAIALDPGNEAIARELNTLQKQNKKTAVTAARARKEADKKEEEPKPLSLNAPVGEVFSRLFKRK